MENCQCKYFLLTLPCDVAWDTNYPQVKSKLSLQQVPRNTRGGRVIFQWGEGKGHLIRLLWCSRFAEEKVWALNTSWRGIIDYNLEGFLKRFSKVLRGSKNDFNNELSERISSDTQFVFEISRLLDTSQLLEMGLNLPRLVMTWL